MTEATSPMGLQFNPERGMANQVSHSTKNASIRQGESQEITVGNTAGKAILLGDEIDLETDNNGDHLSTSTYSKNGACPNWLGGSSSKTKGLLGLTAVMLLSFVAVMIAGVAKPSSSSPENGSGGGVGSVSQNTAMDPSISTVPVPVPAPAPTSPEPVRPNTATTATSSPTQDSVIIPIKNSEVNIQLPVFAATKVPDFSDGLNITEERNWNQIEGILERTIYSSLSTELAQCLTTVDYSLESIQVNKFDGFMTNLIRKRTLTTNGWSNRYLQQTIHTVLYSSSVTISCLGGSQCVSASNTVASATSALSNSEFLVVSDGETDAPSLGVVTNKPTKSPIAAIVLTLAPISTPPTLVPTARPVTPFPTSMPDTETPTLTPPPPPLEHRADSCNIYTQCEICQGFCYNNDQCERGLVCFLRRDYEFIPGCEGPGIEGGSYCYDPFATGLTEVELLRPVDQYCDHKERCEKCRGHCSEDDDCEKGLYCWRRYELELIPGCAGQGLYGMSYCFDPADIEGVGGEPFR